MALSTPLGKRLLGAALVLQIVPVCGALLVAEAARSTGRATLLIPLSAAARQHLPAAALDGHTLLLGGGLLPGSLVVRAGDAATLPSWRDAVIALPVPAPSCGARRL